MFSYDHGSSRTRNDLENEESQNKVKKVWNEWWIREGLLQTWKEIKKKQHDEAKTNGINLVEGSERSNAMCNINEYLRDNELESS